VTDICRIQEFVLAEKDPEIHLGHVSISWEAFKMYIVGFRVCDVKHDHIAGAPELLDYLYEFIQPKWAVHSLNWLRLARSSLTLAHALVVTAQFQATDPRDKVYGILGLLDPSVLTKAITIDYSKSIREVIIDIAKVFVTNEPLALYSNFVLQTLREKDRVHFCEVQDLPSWAMDLTKSPTDLDATGTHNRPSRFIPANLKVNPKRDNIARVNDDNSLHTIGTYIGTVVETSQDLLFNAPESVKETLFYVYNKMLKPRNISVEHLMRTIFEFSKGSARVGKFLNGPLFTRMKQTTPETKDQETMLHYCIRDRILFVTSDGHMGFSYHPDTTNGIRPGDVVVGLCSSNVPFILRKTRSGKDYQMINIAYVGDHVCSHPAIDKALEETTAEDIWSDLGKFGVEEYTIV
jgi:hypothetical protein